MPPQDPATNPRAEMLRAELEFLSKLSQVVASTLELQPILDWIVRETTALLSADEGLIRLPDPDVAGDPMRTRVRRRSSGTESGSWSPSVSMSVEGYLSVREEVLATSDLHDDPRFPGLRGKPTGVRSLLAVPLKVGGQVTGMLAVAHARPGRQWMPDEIQLMTIVAHSSAGVLEQARLRLEAAERARLAEMAQRMENELVQAREIQMGLVPSQALRMGPWEAVGRIDPARMVGGDAFNFYPLAGERLAVAIADVSGKGVPAALLMSSVQASLRAYCDGRRGVPEAMQHLNRGVSRAASAGKFITLFYAEIDLDAGVLRYSNAGHNYPLLRRADGRLEPLKTGGLPLGLFEDGMFAEGRAAFAPGDSLLLYSDGVSEAINPGGEEFGEARLEQLWREHGAGRPEAVVEKLMGALAEFRGPAAQNDDVTLVVVGKHSS